MKKALAMVEYSTVSSGIKACDLIAKTSLVEILDAKTVCPGKFLILFCGEISAVRASYEAVGHICSENRIDGFVLASPHDSIIPAINGQLNKAIDAALGVVETYSAASAITAADIAAKSAYVDLVEIRVAEDMCGKSYIMFTGDIANVSAALDCVKTSISKAGMLLDAVMITKPDQKTIRAILGGRGQ